jgi:hypothetical protein
VTLAKSPDRRIAGHFPNRGKAVGQENRIGAESGPCRRGFHAGVTASDHHHICLHPPLLFHVEQPY